jgi:hypothetical protein
VLEAVFILLEFPSPSRRIFIGSHSLPPSLVRRIGPSENPGKLHESWEGPFIAKETDMPGAFCLREQTGEELPYSWNADSLKRYYP